MASPQNRNTYKALNRLETILRRSLPVYLTYTSPWTRPGEEESLATLRRVADDISQLADRVSTYTNDHFGPPEVGEFPIDFFDTHDLSLDFLLRKLVECQKRDVAALESVVPQLAFDRPAAALAEEALGAARGHLETFESLAAANKPSTVTLA